jgi:hypothetical protein
MCWTKHSVVGTKNTKTFCNIGKRNIWNVRTNDHHRPGIRTRQRAQHPRTQIAISLRLAGDEEGPNPTFQTLTIWRNG